MGTGCVWCGCLRCISELPNVYSNNASAVIEERREEHGGAVGEMSMT